MDEDNDGQVLEARRVQQVNAHERQEQIDNHVLANMKETLSIMLSAKPSEKNDLERRYSIALNSATAALNIFKLCVMDRDKK